MFNVDRSVITSACPDADQLECVFAVVENIKKTEV